MVNLSHGVPSNFSLIIARREPEWVVWGNTRRQKGAIIFTNYYPEMFFLLNLPSRMLRLMSAIGRIKSSPGAVCDQVERKK